MTIARSDVDPLDALYTCASHYPGGMPALAARLGMHVRTLYNKLQRGVRTHHLNYLEFIRILECCEEANVPEVDLILDAIDWRFGRVSFKVPSVEKVDSTIVNNLLHVMQEQGNLAKELEVALGDNRITLREMAALEKRVQQATEAQIQLLEMLREKHRADQSKLPEQGF